MRIDAVDVELLMWLVRFRLRRYRHHPQFEDVLAAAYEGLWRGVTRREANPKAEGLLTEWALRGAEWQVKSWFRSAENAGRVMRRSHGRMVAAAQFVPWDERDEAGQASGRGRIGHRWEEWVAEAVDAERRAKEGHPPDTG